MKPEDIDFLKTYQDQNTHRFRDLERYARLLSFLSKHDRKETF